MNSTSPYDLDSSTGITPMSESLVGNTTNPPLITTNDIDLATEDKHLLLNQDNSSSSPNPIDNIPLESPSSSNIITKKQKSLISVYDNSNDGEQQHQQASNPNSLPLVGILGRNQRSEAFRKRLLLSAFPKPILCDTKSPEFDFNNQSNYVSSDIFLRQSPSIILITENFSHNSEHFFNLNKQQLIIDVRELNFSKNSSHSPLPIPECYQAFGNLSNWEIENGTQRVAVAVEQSSPLNLIKFIHQLNCFSRGITSVDQYTYNNERIKSFRHCLFPLISTIVIFSICFIFSLIEYRVDHHTHSRIDYLYHQASSITAVTSLTLLSLLFLIRPLLESMEYFSKILNQQTQRWLFLSRWLQSRRYLAWYSLAFACLHVLFYLISKNDYNEKLFFLPAFFGVITLVVLTILSFVYLPWISERLLWREYHLLASYFGPFGLLIAFLHVFIHWKYDYYYHTGEKQLFTLKFLSMFLPFLVLVLRILIYGIIRPVNKLLRIRQKRSKTSIETKKDTTLLP